MPNFRRNKVHPTTHPQSCRCRGCLKKKREQKVETRAVLYSFYFMFFLLLAIA